MEITIHSRSDKELFDGWTFHGVVDGARSKSLVKNFALSIMVMTSPRICLDAWMALVDEK